MKKEWWPTLAAVAFLLSGCSTAADTPVAARPVTIRITLARTTITAGRDIAGEAIVTNTTSRSVVVHDCPNEWLQVGLDSKVVHFSPSSGLVLCRPSLRLRPGANRFPLTVSTSYSTCAQQGGGVVSGGRRIPACTGSSTNPMPPLPPGNYTVRVYVLGLSPVPQVPMRMAVKLLAPRH